jgi:molybdopterin-guanine dinucleotide biosynthesis protein A
MQPAPPTSIPAAILAGGKATRYGGVAKGLLRLPDGVAIIERLLRVVGETAITEIVICANDATSYAHLGHEIIADAVPDAGPLGGIAAALRHFAGRADGVLILPCDMPAITEREIGALVQAFGKSDARLVVAATGEGEMQPLCAAVSTSLLGKVIQAIEAGELAVGRFWRKVGAELVRFPDAKPFANVNTPEEMAAWVETMGE